MCKLSVNGPSDSVELEPTDAWLKEFNYEGFRADIKALGEELDKGQGEEDVRHLNKMISWCNACAAIGLLTMGFSVNIVTVLALSTWTFVRWTMIAHHTCHGGYDKCHPQKGRFNRFKFALGSTWNRFCDWLDWMLPEAWNVEHNNRHHYCLSELDDPDFVEENMSTLRGLNIPTPLKYVVVSLIILIWKWQYYAPNTYKELKLAKLRREGKSVPEGVQADRPITIVEVLFGGNPFYSAWEYLTVVAGPYFVIHFLLLPLPYVFVGQYLQMENMYKNAVFNLILAEFATNLHAFIAIGTNHCGSDLYRFKSGCRPYSGSFFMRQVLASANYHCGTDLIDFLHGYLNYQVEHHLWPSLSMRSYQKAAPRVRAICKKHNIPYVKESVLTRLRKTVQVMVGKENQRWFPEDYEQKYLKLDTMATNAKLTKQ